MNDGSCPQTTWTPETPPQTNWTFAGCLAGAATPTVPPPVTTSSIYDGLLLSSVGLE